MKTYEVELRDKDKKKTYTEYCQAESLEKAFEKAEKYANSENLIVSSVSESLE